MKLLVKQIAAIDGLYGLKVGDIITTCDAPEGWEDGSIWMSKAENPHVEIEESWQWCENFCIASGEEQFTQDFEILEGK